MSCLKLCLTCVCCLFLNKIAKPNLFFLCSYSLKMNLQIMFIDFGFILGFFYRIVSGDNKTLPRSNSIKIRPFNYFYCTMAMKWMRQKKCILLCFYQLYLMTITISFWHILISTRACHILTRDTRTCIYALRIHGIFQILRNELFVGFTNLFTTVLHITL